MKSDLWTQAGWLVEWAEVRGLVSDFDGFAVFF